MNTALAAEATTRSIADANLQTGLNVEIADRASCCDSLQSQIDDIQVTTSCCETLQEQINNEVLAENGFRKCFKCRSGSTSKLL